MNIKILTLFPRMFEAPMGESIIGRAKDNGIVNIEYFDIRQYSDNKHKSVDDYPYGGGPGMVMQVQPLFSALESINAKNGRVIYMSPKGRSLNQQLSVELSREANLTIICGHYEGIDQRVIDYWVTDEISIGDYVLTGGELPAMVLIDSVVRLIPGVLGQEESFKDESFFSGLLEYPHYTRPSEYRGLEVPDVLLSGNHKKIDEWRKSESFKVTMMKRPDLYEKYIQRQDLSKDEKKILEGLGKNT